MTNTDNKVVKIPRGRLLSTLNDIALFIEENYNNEMTCGGLTGSAGLATFSFYYAQYTGEDYYANLGQDLLGHAIDKVFKTPFIDTYCSGLAGLGWTLEFLKEQDFIDINNDKWLGDIDKLLYEKMITDLKNKNYDIHHGGLGYLFYFIKRHQCTQSRLLRKKYTSYLLEGLEILERMGVHHEDTIYWLSTLSPKHNKGMINTGFAYGLAGILSVLGSASKVKEIKPKATELLDKAVNFLLSIKNSKQSLNMFPTRLNSANSEITDTDRTTWCYGDLSIAMALLKLSKLPEYNYLRDEAILHLDAHIKINHQNVLEVEATGFCNGAFGMAHCYGNAFHKLGVSAYKEEQDSWMKKAFKIKQSQFDYAGFTGYTGKEESWDGRLSVLEGVAGIGLVIIDYLRGEHSNWDEMLLLG